MQLEQQARLAGMLFAARELATRMNDGLAESSAVIDLLRPQSAIPLELREAIERLAAKVSDVMDDIAALQNLIPARSTDQPPRMIPDEGRPTLEP
jgi:hypothetical protein